MNTINTSQMLQNLDVMKAASSNNNNSNTNSNSNGNSAGGNFSGIIKSAIDNVNQTSKIAAKMTAAVEAGDRSVSVVDTMVALQKARIQSQALMQVRNKVLSAYKDIMNMPV
jgi:flagellar hook-basal body complex protein FliE